MPFVTKQPLCPIPCPKKCRVGLRARGHVANASRGEVALVADVAPTAGKMEP